MMDIGELATPTNHQYVISGIRDSKLPRLLELFSQTCGMVWVAPADHALFLGYVSNVKILALDGSHEKKHHLARFSSCFEWGIPRTLPLYV
jgi:hypothetical protein